MNSKDFTIGILSVTAAILLTALILMHALAPKQAFAETGVTIGQYVVTTSRTDETTGMITILDTATMRMNFYALNPQTNELLLLQPPMDVRSQQQPRGAVAPRAR